MSSSVRAAGERRDADALIALLADDVVFRSPLTDVPIRGREGAGDLVRAVFAAFELLEYDHALRDGPVEVLVGRARVGGRDVRIADVITYDDAGRITEFAVYGRPMSGVAAFASAVGPRLAARHGRARGTATRALAGPLPGLLARADRLAMKLAGARGT